jgi:hypothetical protein
MSPVIRRLGSAAALCGLAITLGIMASSAAAESLPDVTFALESGYGNCATVVAEHVVTKPCELLDLDQQFISLNGSTIESVGDPGRCLTLVFLVTEEEEQGYVKALTCDGAETQGWAVRGSGPYVIYNESEGGYGGMEATSHNGEKVYYTGLYGNPPGAFWTFPLIS